MAVLERSDCKDRVGVFACKTWTMVGSFPVSTSDAEDLSWSPDGRAICVTDSVVNHRVCVYQPDGRELAVHSAYEHALGVKTVAWSPSAQLLAVGSYDQKVRLLNHLTWGLITTLDHAVQTPEARAAVYREVETRDATDRIEAFPVTGGLHSTGSRYEVEDHPSQLESVRADPEKPFPKVDQSHCNTYHVARALRSHFPTLCPRYSAAEMNLFQRARASKSKVIQFGELCMREIGAVALPPGAETTVGHVHYSRVACW
jgi:WD40 repeat protein